MILLIVGLLIGASAGVFIACLLVAAKRGEPEDIESINTAYVQGYLDGARDKRRERMS